ncbi:hypothetical protein BDW02DRAFT_491799 [Decorospora gaudefroyi]|uniref:Uncharacterized protein n=1 Tax=Decorospora gaudefroyi TaxID=184978 RepID=A0A6A5KUH6_9PLEO|nr:hypothetical protein BDW02DRAFT_491799 [Decorospora gaudefroyi]
MYLTSILATLFSTLPATLSAPSSPLRHASDPYQCGYVLTARNASVYAGLSAYSACTAIYYNQSIPGYQDAYAYTLYGGCQCTFHLTGEDCFKDTEAPIYHGPTFGKPGQESLFEEPMPKWYNCVRSE